MRPRQIFGALMIAGLLAACGGDEEVLPPDPVFALDRDVAVDIVPVDASRGAVLPAAELRVVLQGLLTDHVTLSNEAMRRAIDGGDVAATLAALTDNTDGLTLAIGLVYGPDGARAFDQLWTNHIEFFNAYAVAVAAGDRDSMAAIREQLGHYEHDFSRFVEVATAETLDLATVLHVLHGHVEQLLGQAETWEQGRYDEAIQLASESVAHADEIAGALAGAFVVQSPEAFPVTDSTIDAGRCLEDLLLVRQFVNAAAEVVTAEVVGPEPYVFVATAALSEATERVASIIGDRERAVLVDGLRSGPVPETRRDALEIVSAVVGCAAVGTS